MKPIRPNQVKNLKNLEISRCVNACMEYINDHLNGTLLHGKRFVICYKLVHVFKTENTYNHALFQAKEKMIINKAISRYRPYWKLSVSYEESTNTFEIIVRNRV